VNGAAAIAAAPATSGPQLLAAEALIKGYRTAPRWHVWNRHVRRVVDGVSLQVRRGEVVGLLGPNGAGKTTTFNMIVGLLRPQGGRVLLDSADVSGLPMHLRARAGVGYLPQEASIFRKLTVKDNFLAVLEMMPLSEAQREARAEELLHEFGLGHVSDSTGETLSGGERRRAEIARSLIRNPAFILFDEPFAGIDPIAVHEIQRQVEGLRTRGIGVLITDHNVRDTLHICDRAYIIADGRILEEGPPEKIAQSARARQVYLGERFKLDGPAVVPVPNGTPGGGVPPMGR
jgi:lipopolysaccharide export system ATP-binding protein